ncbi:MAG: ABC transporter substrate binding protein [Candidatus Acidiferrales bacterium]
MTIWAFERAGRSWLLLLALGLAISAPASQAQVRKTILVINQFGQSLPVSEVVTNQIRSAVHSDPRFQVQFYWENLDAVDLSNGSLNEQSTLVAQRYLGQRLDLIVLLGPDPLRLMADRSKAFHPDVPVVFCCSAQGQPGQPFVDSRSTGSWLQFEPAKTLDAALRLLPQTRQVFVVAGQSKFDKGVTALAKAGLTSYEARLDVTYLTNLSMKQIQERLSNPPSHSIVLFLTFFKDVEGREFASTVEALPMVVAASNAPVFGVSDTYLGRGIVGGFVVSLEEQGKIAGRDILAILAGKSPQDIPVVYGPSVYMFDSRELRRWNLDESKLPAGSTILFRKSTLWERYKLTALTGALFVVSLVLLIVYLLYKQRRLRLAEKAPEELSGMLINAQEQERRRIASEIHDDFSQRLATLTLGMETAAQLIPVSPHDASLQMEELSSAAIDLGADLHTLSHRLHSATLENLGLTPAVSALCKEFSGQQGIKIESTLDPVPRSIDRDAALCVFRIAQESLRNVKKHSGATSAQVRLQLEGNTIHFSVSDPGVGFNPKEPRKGEGLGIRSMEERARLLGGRFKVQSKAGTGTKISLWLPLQTKSKISKAQDSNKYNRGLR